MWRKPSSDNPGKFVILSAYVGDNLLTGPSVREVENEAAKILGVFRAKTLYPAIKDKWQIWDVLGAELSYNRSDRRFKLSTQTYIEKLADKLNVRAGSPSPNAEESPVCEESAPVDSRFEKW